MRRTVHGLIVILAAGGLTGYAADGVRVVPNEADHRVDITINGQPFTSYIWPPTVKKPVLYPIRSADGLLVTRGFPLDPRPGERIDHPHHVGLWFNYGNVNGLDFWNNSDAVPAADAPKFGTIHHRRIVDTKSGPERGELAIEATWDKPDGKSLLREQTRFVFEAGPGARSIDRITTLTALEEKVSFDDNKEGVFGMRVARGLEQPSTQPERLTDAQGRPSSVPLVDNEGVAGEYLSSEGKRGDAVWGTRGRWVMLTGTLEGKPITVAILDHPSNPGFPAYWHARGYGLFAANPLGQKALSNGKETLNFALEPGRSATFRYRVLILNGAATAEQIESKYRSFTAGS
jgi:hypothetical protein